MNNVQRENEKVTVTQSHIHNIANPGGENFGKILGKA